jgi:hypothetical protein
MVINMPNILDRDFVDVDDIFAKFYNLESQKWTRIVINTLAVGSNDIAFFRNTPIKRGSLTIQKVPIGRIENLERQQVGLFDQCEFMLDPLGNIDHYSPLYYHANHLAMIDFNPITTRLGYHTTHYFEVTADGQVNLCKAGMEVFYFPT